MRAREQLKVREKGFRLVVQVDFVRRSVVVMVAVAAGRDEGKDRVVGGVLSGRDGGDG